MKYLETLTRECSTVKGKATLVSIQKGSSDEPQWPSLNLGSTSVCSRLLSEGPKQHIATRSLQNKGESGSRRMRTAEHPLLLWHGNPRADRWTTPAVIRNGGGTAGSRGGCTLQAIGTNGFEALVATIQQRDSANERAEFWKRAFLLLVAFAGTASTTIGLALMKGRL